MTAPPHTALRFLDYVVDVANGQAWHGERELDLRPKALAVLAYLAANPQRLVTKRELIDAVWGTTAVTDWVLTTCVRELRDALGDDARQPRIVETVHGRGYRFIAEISRPSTVDRSQTTVPRPQFDIVGRAADLAELEIWLRRALAGERQVVFIAGEAGIGKTTLVDVFFSSLSTIDSELLTARGQCIEQRGAGEPYLPVLEAFGRLCVQPGGAPLIDLMRRHAPAWLVQMPGLLEPSECEALERRLGATTRERLLREMAALVAALPAPLILVLEDLHWSDHATLDLVSTLAQRRDAARLMLIGTYRPVEVAVHHHPLRTIHLDLRTHAWCQDLWLSPLSEAAVAEYLHARWPGLESVGELARVLHECTDGNPLFLVNSVDHLAASGAVTQGADGWTLQGDVAALASRVPPGLRELIAAQSERLDAAARAALEAGSVVGRSFSAALVAAALEAPVVAIEERLAQLAHGGVMIGADGTSTWPDRTVAGAYRFNHALYQSVMRERVPPARRQQLHERIAARLERAYAGHVTEVSSELAFHFEAGGHAAQAVPYLEEAATTALRRGANREATGLLDHGLEILDSLPRTPEHPLRIIRLCMAMGASLTPSGDHSRIEKIFERARQLSEASGDSVQLFQALIALTGTHIGLARLARARETARALQGLIAALPIPSFEFAGSLFMGMVEYHAGSLSDARTHLERAVALEDVPLPPMSVNMHVMVPAYLALTLVHLGYPEQARMRLRQAVARAAAAERPFDRSFAAHVTCFTSLILRDLEQLAPAAEQAAALDDFPAVAAIGRLSRGRVLSGQGEHGRGIEMIREAIAAYRTTGQRIALPAMLAVLAEGHAAAGEVAAALACVADARALVESTGEVRYVAELYRLEGTLHAADGDWKAAETCLQQALAMAREQGARWWELRATISCARLTPPRGKQATSRRTRRDDLERLVAAFTEGFDTADLQDAKAVLEELR